MPAVAVEEAVREYIFQLRHPQHRSLPLANHGPENYILTPLLHNLDRAVADLLEHLTDVGGGVEGVIHTFAALADHAYHLPGGPAHHDGAEYDEAMERAQQLLRFEHLITPTEAPTPC